MFFLARMWLTVWNKCFWHSVDAIIWTSIYLRSFVLYPWYSAFGFLQNFFINICPSKFRQSFSIFSYKKQNMMLLYGYFCISAHLWDLWFIFFTTWLLQITIWMYYNRLALYLVICRMMQCVLVVAQHLLNYSPVDCKIYVYLYCAWYCMVVNLI
jgi:hypothetical protein